MMKVKRVLPLSDYTINRGLDILKRLGVSSLALVIMLSSCAKPKAKTEGKYVFVKQPHVVGDNYYQFHWQDKDEDGLIEDGEVLCRTIKIDNQMVVEAQTDANVLAVSDNPVEEAFAYVGEYTEDMGDLPTTDEVRKMVNDSMPAQQKFVMLKRPEVSADGKYVRWYYFVDKNGDGQMNYSEICYYDEPIDPDKDYIPAQPNANVLAVGSDLLLDGWQVYDVYDEDKYPDLDDVEDIERQIRRNEKNNQNRLVLVP